MIQKLIFPSLLLLIMALFSCPSSAQEISQPLKEFDKIQVSPFISLVLEEGETEHIRIEYAGIEPEKINYSVRGKKLRIYLDEAKYTGKTEEVFSGGHWQELPVYRNVKITAYVSYKSLKKLQIRGEEKVSCSDSIRSRNFKISMFGESRADLAFVQADRLVVNAFGENNLIIRSGDAGFLKFRLFGENKIKTDGMYTERISTGFFGESIMDIYSVGEISLWGVGEADVRYSGHPQLDRFILGEADITEW